jgi:murein DD-endopeptidase MepM/ murein hydrolase activator NlpD
MGVSGVKEFYYFHPINFLRYVCSEFVMEFNPYFGEHKDTDKNLFVCKSNPGFAPVSAGNTEYKHDGVSYAVCTSLFNAKRDVGSGNPHGGVDLAPGGAGKEIKSLIYGEVWACTYDKDVVNTYNSSPQDIICFGKVMIIKGSDNKLYLLAHLDDYKKEVGAFVSPGDTVAICGTTGYSTGFHLHLEVILCEETDKKKVLDKNGNNKSKSEGTGLKWAEDYSNRYPFLRNPFNHDDPYKGQ